MPPLFHKEDADNLLLRQKQPQLLPIHRRKIRPLPPMKRKKIGSKRTNFSFTAMLFTPLFVPFILSIQNNQNHNQRCESHAGSHPAIGGNSGRQITEETARRYAQHIRDLGRYVVDVVALGASRRKDGRIRDRGNMVAADRTCQNRAVTIVRLFIFPAPTTANAIGSRIPKVPQDVPVENAMPPAMTNIRPASGSRPAHCRPLPL